MSDALMLPEEDVCYDEVSLRIRPGLPFDRWLSIGETLFQMEKSVMWWIGDWWRYGDRAYGQMASQAAQDSVLDQTGYRYNTVRRAGYVASRFESDRRRSDLDWWVHLEVADLEPHEQEKWLDRAKKMTRSVLRDELRQYTLHKSLPAAPDMPEAVSDLQTLIGAGKKFGTIYADPAWRYDNQSTRAATDNHYLTMSVEEICELPVKQLSAENAHLHIWTTNAFLPRTFEVIEAWGFEYKSMYVWCKPSIGIGNYWRVSHELLLFAVKGSAPFLDRSLRSWGEHKRGKHSSKPEPIRELIEKASPAARLELFGRRVTDGWTVWGNQIDKDLMHP